ncbi:MAG: hypothetical protein HN704_06245 [Bacteroidetes bacterium]|jgi:hypothetical protein|nr:hypothetical protein [Bacteroidota bacterium]MBT6685108.1 hypothetical protein [Bacteroidota bacterium]MBT7141927.1 hypothetical protein [Bacteroidota bacterium]MBT7491188.1 hypothetical protein [Bacteroidota bacterium]
MTYNIKILNDSTPQAKSLLMMLKSLAIDYDFLQIEQEDENNLSTDLMEELDYRYEHFVTHANEYKDWDTIKHKYMKK